MRLRPRWLWIVSAIASTVVLLAVVAMVPIFRQARAVSVLEKQGLFYEGLGPGAEWRYVRLNMPGIVSCKLNGVRVGYVMRHAVIDDAMIDAFERLPCVKTFDCWECTILDDAKLARLSALRSRHSISEVGLSDCILPDGKLAKEMTLK